MNNKDKIMIKGALEVIKKEENQDILNKIKEYKKQGFKSRELSSLIYGMQKRIFQKIDAFVEEGAKSPKKERLKLIDELNNTKLKSTQIEFNRIEKRRNRIKESIIDSINNRIYKDNILNEYNISSFVNLLNIYNDFLYIEKSDYLWWKYYIN